MKPGLELDILIAEKVMGENVVINKSGSKAGGYYYSLGPARWYDMQGDMQLANPVPAYSEDISAVWQLVEKLPFVFELITNNPYGPTTPETEWMATFNAEFEAHGESAPHAICLAALKAVGA